jgi:flagellin
MRINTNVAALNSYNQLNNTNNKLSKSLGRLSSGKRINSASDDAAGLAISEKMNAQTRGLAQAQRNAQDGISMIQTAEGALKESHSILQRMRELTVQAANDTLSDDDRGAISTEISQLEDELTRISTTTEFNGKTLLSGNLGVKRDGGTLASTVTGLSSNDDIDVSGAATGETYTIAETANTVTLTDSDGNSQAIDLTSAGFTAGDKLDFDSLGVSIDTDTDYDASSTNFNTLTITTDTTSGATLQIGANDNQNLAIDIGDMSATGLGVNGIDVSSHSASDTSIGLIDSAIKDVSDQRSTLGAWQNRLDHTINNLSTAEENLTAAESRISDVDMAKEMMNLSKQQILSQAGTAMMAQANQLPQGVLQLLG